MTKKKFAIGAALALGALVWAHAFAAEGDVTVLAADGTAKAAAPGEEVVTTDGAVSRFDIEGVGGAVTSPCPVCKLTRSAVAKGGLEIRHGAMLVDADRLAKGSTFQLKCPVAVASVRGTRFAGYVHHDGSETIVVQRGAVDVSAQGGAAQALGPGQAVDVSADGKTSAARAASAEETAALEAMGSEG